MEGLEPRLVTSSLAECYSDPTELAYASFQALGEGLTWWHEDNGITGAVQTAVEELPIETFVRALETVHDDELALRGAARVYFRFQLADRLTPDARAKWTVRLAECVMRRGYPADQALALHGLASIDDPNINLFLRSIALGKRTFPEDARQPVADIRGFEPSWSCGAALILALRGEARAARLVRRLERAHHSESDGLALALARAALDDRTPFPARTFTAYSFLLGRTGIDLMERRAASVPPAVLVAAASARLDPVGTAARAAIRRLGLNLTIDNRPLADAVGVSAWLVSEHPRRAIVECDALLPTTANDQQRAMLLTYRAQAQRNLGNIEAAIADYHKAAESPWADRANIETQLAWLYFNIGRLDEARSAVERAFARGCPPDAELYQLRGMLAFAADDFSQKVEDEFITAATLDPSSGYALLFQHLTALLAKRSEASRLLAAQPADLVTGGGVTVSVPGLRLQIGDVGVPWWPRQLMAFFRGEITSEQLLASAAGGLPERARLQQAEAAFYLGQAARIAGDSAAERAHLERCVAAPIDELAEYHLAFERLRRLESASSTEIHSP